MDVTGEADAMMLSLEQNDDKAVKELDAELQVIGIMIFRVGQFYTFLHVFVFCSHFVL